MRWGSRTGRVGAICRGLSRSIPRWILMKITSTFVQVMGQRIPADGDLVISWQIVDWNWGFAIGDVVVRDRSDDTSCHRQPMPIRTVIHI